MANGDSHFLGSYMNNVPWSKSEKDFISSNYEFGDERFIIDNLPNRTWDGIKIQASKMKIKRRKFSFKKNDLRFLLEEKLESYYWIGFLLADGYFSKDRIKLTVARKDKDHIQKLAQSCFSNVNSDLKTSTLSMQDTVLVKNIKDKFNINDRKTYNPCDLSCLNGKKMFSLIIGFIDGDGCIKKQHKRKDCLLTIKCHGSWLESLDLFSNFISKKFQIKTPNSYLDKNGYAVINIGNNSLLRAMKKEAIENKLPFLERKWNKIS